MTKIVIHCDWGGFKLSDENVRRYSTISGKSLFQVEYEDFPMWFTKPKEEHPEWLVDKDHRELTSKEQHEYYSSWDAINFFPNDIARNDPALVQVVEEMLHSGEVTDLRVVEIPDDVKWHIHNYDGFEHVAENHRTWR